VLELCERGPPVERCKLGQIGIGARAAMLVDRDPARDGVRPGPEMFAVFQVGIPA
jgi:hypothetical protein